MMTFKNIRFTGRRDYECTNVIALQAPSAADVQAWAKANNQTGDNWAECSESILMGLNQLWRQGDVRVFGHL
jgi:hypothetical protein